METPNKENNRKTLKNIRKNGKNVPNISKDNPSDIPGFPLQDPKEPGALGFQLERKIEEKL